MHARMHARTHVAILETRKLRKFEAGLEASLTLLQIRQVVGRRARFLPSVLVCLDQDERASVRACMRACVQTCVRACVRACVGACIPACVENLARLHVRQWPSPFLSPSACLHAQTVHSHICLYAGVRARRLDDAP